MILLFSTLKRKLKKMGYKLYPAQETIEPNGDQHIDSWQFDGNGRDGQEFNLQISPDGDFHLGSWFGSKPILPPNDVIKLLKSYIWYRHSHHWYQKHMPSLEKQML